MAFNVYRSGDASAPVLTGSGGTLTALFDAILVNGYGTQPAAGWSIAATSASIRAYRQGAGAQFYFSVADNKPGTDNYQAAFMWGFETVTGASLGTGQMPSSGEIVVRKSASGGSTGDSVARNWVCFADNRTCYLFVCTGDTNAPAGSYMSVLFGDFFSLVSGDVYNTFIIGNPTPGTANDYSAVTTYATNGSGLSGHFIDRAYTGASGAVPATKHGDGSKIGGAQDTSGGNTATGGIPTPNQTDNAYYLSPFWLCESNIPTVRGRLRGLWYIPFSVPNNFDDGQTFSVGMNGASIKTFQLVKLLSVGAGTGGSGAVMVETSNTLETNAT